MRVLEVYPFGKGLGQAFRRRGHDVFVVDFRERPAFQVTGAVVPSDELGAWEPPIGLDRWDLVLLRPFCTTYSRASAFKHYRDNRTGEALTVAAREGDRVVLDTLRIAARAKPRHGFVLETPHALLAKTAFMQGVPVVTVTLCQYGSKFRKATDLFGNVPPTFVPKACKIGADCHLHAHWVDRNGQTLGGFANNQTAGREFDRQSKFERAFLPYRLSSALEHAFRRQVDGTTEPEPEDET